MSDQGPIRLGIIGAGLFARDAHVPALQRLADQFEIAAICSRTAASTDKLAALLEHPVEIYHDMADLLARDDIEAVDLVLPIHLLPHATTMALAAGKHVISEKPVAPSVAEGRLLLEAYAKRPEQVWMVAENYRYEEAFLKASEIVASGAIGRVMLADWAIYVHSATSKYYHTLWRRDNSYDGGFLLDGGVHHVAGLRMVLGEIASVSASIAQVRPDLPPADTLSAALEFESGALGAYSATFAGGAPWYGPLQVVGDRGAVRLVRDSTLEVTTGGETEQVDIQPFGGVVGELAAFAAAIRDGAPHHNAPEQALQDVAVIEAMLRSAREGRRIQPERVVS